MNIIAPGIGHNEGPIVDAEILDRIEAILDTATLWLTIRPEFANEDEANKARDFIQQIRDEKKIADKSRKEATQPHRDETQRINDGWNAVISKLDACTKALSRPMTAWLQKLDQERKAEEKRLREEAERAASEAEALRKEAEASTDIRDNIAAKEATERAVDLDTNATKTTKVGVSGNHASRSMGLRTVRSGVITDIEKVFDRYRGHKDVIAILEKLVNMDIRGGAKRIPGVRIITEQKAA